jgi:hypothetical protein
VWRSRVTLDFIEGVSLCKRRLREELRREHLQECWIALAPTELDELDHRLGGLDMLRGRATTQGPAREGATQHEMADAFGMARGVHDRNRAALRHAEKREPVEPGPVDDAFQVCDQTVDRDGVRFTVGQTAAARVVAQQLIALAQRIDPWTPDGSLPIEVEVAEPMRGTDQRRSFACYRIGDTRIVRRSRKLNLRLTQGTRAHAGDYARTDANLSTFTAAMCSNLLERADIWGLGEPRADRREWQLLAYSVEKLDMRSFGGNFGGLKPSPDEFAWL